MKLCLECLLVQWLAGFKGLPLGGQVGLPTLEVEPVEHAGPFLAGVIVDAGRGAPEREHSPGVPLHLGLFRIGLAPATGVGQPLAQQEFTAGAEESIQIADQGEESLGCSIEGRQIARLVPLTISPCNWPAWLAST